MVADAGTFDPRGSLWHRWDPHLHAPGTLFNDQFGGDWERYLTTIEQSEPRIHALGVTDYFCIETYREVRRRREAGRLRDVRLLFPNVEMRLDIKTDSGNPFNIHLLFSPEDPDHELHIKRLLNELTFELEGDRKYRCSLSDLAALGRKLGASNVDDQHARRAGATQFKVRLDHIRELFREKWVRRNCLVAVSGGADGLSGLQKDDSFAVVRRNIERFADVIFSSNPKQRDFWLGKLPQFPAEVIERTYRFLKPCLHGSDAHNQIATGAPALDRFCWIKGDLCFETLRQAVIEPESRVSIGAAPPQHTILSAAIASVATAETPWLANDNVQFNPCLVAIVGARGSGKTALAEVLAAGGSARSAGRGASSFLNRAADHLVGATVSLQWADGASAVLPLRPFDDDEWDPPREEVRYLSQHFVERLCSSDDGNIELKQEIERVVFDNTEDRYETNSFEELAELLLDPIRRRRSELQEAIADLTEQVVHEDLLLAQLPTLRKDRDALKKQIEGTQKALAALLPKGNEARVKRLGALETAVLTIQGRVDALRRREKAIQDLTAEAKHVIGVVEPRRWSEMQRRFTAAELTAADWRAFEMKFAGDVDRITQSAATTVQRALSLAVDGDPNVRPEQLQTSPMDSWPLKVVIAQRDQAQKEVGIDRDRQKKYEEQRRLLSQYQTALARSEEQVKHAEGASSRRKEHVDSRRKLYAQVFDEFAKEERVLENLYAPLKQQLADARGALAKLTFVAQRRVNLQKWCAAGERQMDLRSATRFRGYGALRREAEKSLAVAWRTGAAEAVSAAMEAFREELSNDLMSAMAAVPAADRPAAYRELAEWLYDTSHITIEYGIEYEGVGIDRLSPGTKGIVLLLLYLAVDRQDIRPLIIDQPEENLDPNSVFKELVPHFREARERRQVIIVTHNANLVVNTDADQVVIATSERRFGAALPTMSYTTGSLESDDIRRAVCKTLEGGERAFLERDRRYRLRWGEELLVTDERTDQSLEVKEQ